MILLPIFLGAVYVLARDHLEGFLAMPFESVESGARFLNTSLMDLFWKAAGCSVVFGSVDLFRQTRRHSGDLKMSKQEIKDEMKEMRRQSADEGADSAASSATWRAQHDEGGADGHRRHRQPDALRGRHHVRHGNAWRRPRVVAKGKNYLALRIRQKAIDNQVPIDRESAAGAGALQVRRRRARRFRRSSTVRWRRSSPTFSN